MNPLILRSIGLPRASGASFIGMHRHTSTRATPTHFALKRAKQAQIKQLSTLIELQKIQNKLFADLISQNKALNRQVYTTNAILMPAFSVIYLTAAAFIVVPTLVHMQKPTNED